MFVGAERYVGEIQEPLISTGFYKKKENVNQSFQRLMKENSNELFLKFVRKEIKPGTPKIYTANYEPILLILRANGSEIDEQILEKVLDTFSFINFDFIIHFMNGKRQIHHKRLRWKIVLARYLQYLVASCITPYLLKKKELFSKKDKQKLDPLFSFISKHHKMSTKNQILLDETMEKFISENDVSEKVLVNEIMTKFQDASMKLVFGKQTAKIMQITSSLTDMVHKLL